MIVLYPLGRWPELLSPTTPLRVALAMG